MSGPAISHGEAITLASTLAIAGEILLIGHFAPSVDSRRVTVVQLFAAGGFCFAAAAVSGEGIPDASLGWMSAAVGLGLASAVIQLVMNWAQKLVAPTRATLIYAGEPVWGGLVGWLAGDPLTFVSLIGAALIVAGVLVSELKPDWQRLISALPGSAK